MADGGLIEWGGGTVLTGRGHLERVGRDGLLALTALGFGLILLWAFFFREASLYLQAAGLVDLESPRTFGE